MFTTTNLLICNIRPKSASLNIKIQIQDFLLFSKKFYYLLAPSAQSNPTFLQTPSYPTRPRHSLQNPNSSKNKWTLLSHYLAHNTMLHLPLYMLQALQNMHVMFHFHDTLEKPNNPK